LTSLLEKFGRFNQRLSYLVEWIGLCGLLLMMFITCIDVVGAKIFRLPIPGAIDFVMLSQLFSVSFAVAATLILGRHVEVEFFVPLLPKVVRGIVDCVIQLLGLLLFVLISWRLMTYGHTLQTAHEVTSTVRIPLYPFAYGIALAFIPVCLVYLQRFIVSFLRLIKN
jgi:TRAP-type C4-dicarboxylate transport system permease small subunit